MKTRVSFSFAIVLLALTLGILAGCSKPPARTDAQITTDVQARLYGDSVVQSRQINVRAANGVVTLSGPVTTEDERSAAASDAASVEGVKTVVNNLQVQQAQMSPPAAVVPPPQEAKPAPAMRARPRHGARPNHSRDLDDQPVTPVSSVQAENVPPPQSPPLQEAPPPVPPPPPQKVAIPAGTQLSVRLNDPLDSERNQVGDTFHGSLSTPIVIGGEVVIPSGADVLGRVADVKSAGRFAGNSALTLELVSLAVNGRTYNIQTNQWSREGKGEGKNTATKVGVGTAAGAILGGIIWRRKRRRYRCRRRRGSRHRCSGVQKGPANPVGA